jgi:hypothetical protein
MIMKVFRPAVPLLIFVTLFAVLAIRAHAQTAPLTLGGVAITQQLGSNCPAGFYVGTPQNPTACYVASISCPNTNPVNLTFSYVNGNAPNAPTGTIVLFNGGGGEMTLNDNNQFTAQDYATAKYAVVQTSWQVDWENATAGYANITPPPTANILNAACRPATFLNYIANNSQFHSSSTAMCADAASAGSAGVAYSMVWYGLGSTLNNVEFRSGPVLSNIQIGCQVGNSPPTCAVVCQAGSCNTSSLCGSQVCLSGSANRCSQGTLNEIAASPWTDAPQFVTSYASAVQGWTGNMGPGTCNNVGGSGAATSAKENTTWLQQSIVNGGNGAFSWPSNLQGLGAWACYSYQQNTCYTTQSQCPNNSGAQAEQFYIAVNDSGGNLPSGYGLTGIQQCNGAEGVGDPNSVDPDQPNWSGKTGIEKHMEQWCTVPQ